MLMILKSLKIAHFIVDEKFSDSAYELFETIAPNCNDFFIAAKPYKLKYVKKTPVKFVSKTAFLNRTLIDKIEKYDFVILHSLTNFNQRLVLRFGSSKVIFVWIGMGYDYYDIIAGVEESLLLNKTLQVFAESKRESYERPLWKFILKNKLPYLSIMKKHLLRLLKIKSIKKIHYFSPVLENEYVLVKTKIKKKFPLYIPWNYSTNAHAIDDDCTTENNLRGNNILLGNSASFTNNHIEMIDFLSELALDSRRVICPLNYGDKNYADIIIKHAYQKLGENFVPICDFLPFERYMELISNCSTVLMNHRRQQATGNIVAMLAKGAKVFVREENPVYNLYSSKGIKIFKIEDLEKNPHLLFQKLKSQAIYNNKKIIQQLWGMENCLAMTRNLIDTVMNSTGRS